MRYKVTLKNKISNPDIVFNFKNYAELCDFWIKHKEAILEIGYEIEEVNE